VALITDLCLFAFDRDRDRDRFARRSVHPGHPLEAVRDRTGFDFGLPPGAVATAPEPDAARLALLRGPVRRS
jgi:glutaconate CoA-transferase subunit B